MPALLRGARVMTENGEVPVETLQPGMRVLGAQGEPQRIVWIGRRRIDPRRHPHPEWVQPLRIRRGSVGNGLPRRDLNASPALVVVVNGAAVPLSALVNGATVAPAVIGEAAEYYHVELDRPGTLLAEGLTVESHRDPDDCSVFSNGGRVMLLHPGPAPWPGGGDPATQEVRRRLLQRAHALGHAVTRDSGLQLRVDGWPVVPCVVIGTVHRFLLPPAISDLRIISRAGVPAELDPTAADRRRLGVMIERVVLRDAHGETVLAPDDPLLSEGFHPPETDGNRVWRWTDGHARLPAMLLAGMTRLDLHVGGFQPAWAGTAPPAAPVTRSA